MGTNLRQKQTAMLVRMLNFNTPLADDGDRADGSGWSETVSACSLLMFADHEVEGTEELGILPILTPAASHFDGLYGCLLQWKVLVYDRKCRDIISPLLNVRCVRRQWVVR